MRRRRKNLPNILFHLVLIFELAVFQFAWPLAIARAEDAPAEMPVAEAQEEEEEKTDTLEDNKKGENADEAEESDEAENIEEPEENPEDFWKSCELTKNESDIIKKDDCKECREKTSCEKIKVCLSVFIDVKNEADVENEAESSANTGENSIAVEEKDSPEDQIQETEPAEERDQNGQIVEENPETAENIESSAGSEIVNPEESGVEPQGGTVQQGENQLADLSNDESNETESADQSNEEDNKDNSGAAEEVQAENQNGDSAEIGTADAVAGTNIYNEVNVNVIGENVEKVTENIDGVCTGDINLLEKFDNLLDNASEGGETSVEINIENNAEVENSAAADASTGENSIAGVGDGALISTGDAIAAANIVNIVNLNLIGNNWLFVTINIFGEWFGDLIVPGEGLLSVPGSGGAGDVSITTDNSASVENNAAANANTGENSIEGENGNASIETGNAQSGSSVKNVVNTTIVKNNWFFLVINNMGSWVGKAIHWGGDAGGESYSYDFDENESWENNLVSWFSSIFIKNSADVKNSASAIASTGSNSIGGDFENASVKTGNAAARANIWNFINTNIIGNNWMFATVNIFGKWKGNVDFAYPDLEIALSDGKEKAQNGDEVTYSVSYKNAGRADCEGVDIRVALPEYFDFQGDSSGAPPSRDQGNLTWHLSGLEAGGTKSFNVKGAVSDALPEGEFALSALAAVGTSTKEVEMGNNVASDETIFYRLAGEVAGDNSSDSGNGDGFSEDGQINSALSISRKINDKNVEPGDIVKHTITVENTGGGNLENVAVRDRLKNKKGEVGTYKWEVGNLGQGQKAIINYSLQINTGAPSGDYKSKAGAWGYDPDGQEVKSPEAGVAFHVEVPENGDQDYYYNYYYQNYPPVQYLEGGSGLVDATEASQGLPGQERVLGRWTNGVCHKLPWWGWLAAAIVYLAAVHWSLLRQKRAIEPVNKGK